MKFGRIVLQPNTHGLTSRIFDMTSKFQDGGHAAASAGCPLARPARVTSLACSTRYSS